MRCTTAVNLAPLTQILVAISTVTLAERVNKLNVVQNSYIVTLDSGIYNARDCSPHVQFYRDLRSRGVNWTTLREYHDPVLTGAVVELLSDTDLIRLTDAVGTEFVSPVHVHDAPIAAINRKLNMSKRSQSSGIQWSRTLSSVGKAHAAGYHGEGITIGIVDSGIDYTHPALGGGFGPGYKVVGGYDFIGNEFLIHSRVPLLKPLANPLDKCHGHGTQVAGVLGANPDPEHGLAGVAYEASINAYRIYGCRGGIREDVLIEGLIQADSDGNDIIVTAVGFSQEWSKTTASAIMDRIADRGRIVVSSVGNHGKQGPWSTDRIGRHQRVIGVGSAVKISKDLPIPVYMHHSSAIGPTSDMHLGATLAAPGHRVITTDLRGDYMWFAGTSAAAPFMAGSLALWLQVKGKSAKNTLLARSAFQNTALPMTIHGTDMIDTVARQGAGLVQVYEALHRTGRMLPSELLLNDTTYPRLSWTVKIQNQGRIPIVYTLTHMPSGTMETIVSSSGPPHSLQLVSHIAAIDFSPSRLTVPAGSTQSFTVTVRPPTKLRASRFPVYSGYITAKGLDGTVLRSVYLGLAASMKQMKILNTHLMYMPTQFGRRPDDRSMSQVRIYSMEWNDIPTLAVAFFFAPPLLRLELIEAGVGGSRAARCLSASRTYRSLMRSMGRCGSKTPSRGSVGSTGPPQVKTVGLIQERWDDGLIRWGWERSSVEEIKVTEFADGSVVPDGRYRLLLRVLKRYGDPEDTKDYETWIGPAFIVRRDVF